MASQWSMAQSPRISTTSLHAHTMIPQQHCKKVHRWGKVTRKLTAFEFKRAAAHKSLCEACDSQTSLSQAESSAAPACQMQDALVFMRINLSNDAPAPNPQILLLGTVEKLNPEE